MATEVGSGNEVRTAEQQATVRQRSKTLSICAVICGVASVVVLLSVGVDADHPPAIFAVNFAFCALMMGIGLLFYAKGTPGNRGAVILCVIAMACGVGGTLVFVRQSLLFRVATEGRELANAAGIAKAARHYAEKHDGEYPRDLGALLLSKEITLEMLHSPADPQKSLMVSQVDYELKLMEYYTRVQADSGVDFSPALKFLANNVEHEVDEISDYEYLGNGLRILESGGKERAFPEEILLAASKNTVLGKQMISVSYADGHAEFLEEEATVSAVRASNDARVAAGFLPTRPPGVIQRSEEEKTRKTETGGQ